MRCEGWKLKSGTLWKRVFWGGRRREGIDLGWMSVERDAEEHKVEGGIEKVRGMGPMGRHGEKRGSESERRAFC